MSQSILFLSCELSPTSYTPYFIGLALIRRRWGIGSRTVRERMGKLWKRNEDDAIAIVKGLLTSLWTT